MFLIWEAKAEPQVLKRELVHLMPYDVGSHCALDVFRLDVRTQLSIGPRVGMYGLWLADITDTRCSHRLQLHSDTVASERTVFLPCSVIYHWFPEITDMVQSESTRAKQYCSGNMNAVLYLSLTTAGLPVLHCI